LLGFLGFVLVLVSWVFFFNLPKSNKKNGQDATSEALTPATAYQLTTANQFISTFAAVVKGFYNSRCLSSHTSINLQMHSGCRNNEVLNAFLLES